MKKISWLLSLGLAFSFLSVFSQNITYNIPPLVIDQPEAGLIDMEREIPEFEAIEWTLSNGVHVILKPTDFKNDEILMSGFSWGGLSVVDQSDPITLKCLNDLIKISGVGHFATSSLEKSLRGKTASITPFIDQTTDNISGSCTGNNFEDMLQMVYLYFTEPSFDKDAFNTYSQNLKTMLEQIPAAKRTFADSVCSVLYRNNPLKTSLKPSDVNKINYEKGMSIVKDRFSDIDNFTFTFVGDFQLEDVKPFIELYIGGITPTHRKEYWKHNDDIIVSMKQVSRDYDRKMEHPEVSALLMYSGKMPYSVGGEINIGVLKELVSTVYFDKLKKKNNDHPINIEAALKKFPHELFMFQIDFTTTPKLKNEILSSVKNALTELAANGPNAKDLERVKTEMLKQHEIDAKTNEYWIQVIADKLKYDANKGNGVYEKNVNNITTSAIKTLAEQITQQGQLEIIQNPK